MPKSVNIRQMIVCRATKETRKAGMHHRQECIVLEAICSSILTNFAVETSSGWGTSNSKL